MYMYIYIYIYIYIHIYIRGWTLGNISDKKKEEEEVSSSAPVQFELDIIPPPPHFTGKN